MTRPKWMPSDEECALLFFRSGSFSSDEEWHAAFEHSSKRTGLRAQIAVLEEVISGAASGIRISSVEVKIAALRKEME